MDGKKFRVYDIINAGPKHRFMANGKIVSNCGRLVQPQNLPQNHLEDLAGARELVKTRDAYMLKLMYGSSVPDTLSQLIRTVLTPRRGCVYAIADYSAIEARVIAWLAGEQWVIDSFKAGKDIYCATAGQMFGVPVEKHGVNSHLRQKGKIAQLALGYGGGENAMIAMGALKMGIPEDELTGIKEAWRKANPNIVRFWRTCDQALERVMKNGFAVLPKGIRLRKEVNPVSGLTAMTISLPDGRKLFYASPEMRPARNFPDRLSFHYFGVNQVTRKWEPVDTWGGKLTENLVQAIARSLLCETLLKLKARGLVPVFHVHDEVIVEVPEDRREEGLDLVLRIMGEKPRWIEGDLPLKGAGFTSDFYMKD